MKHILRCSLMLAVAATAGLQAATLTLQPAGGALNGSPGQTVGWGFTLENATDYLQVTAANYVTVTPIGTFTDFASGFNPSWLVRRRRTLWLHSRLICCCRPASVPI